MGGDVTSQVQVFMILDFLGLENLPGAEVVRQSFLPHLRFFCCVLPGLSQLLHVAVQELGTFYRVDKKKSKINDRCLVPICVFHQLLALGNEIHHHLPLVLQAVDDFVVLLNVLLCHLTAGADDLLDRSSKTKFIFIYVSKYIFCKTCCEDHQ